MPTYLDLNPPPVPCAAMAPNNVEKGYACRCFEAMFTRNAVIVSIGTPNVYRVDNTPMGPNDLTVPETTIYWNGLGFGWRAISGLNAAVYLVQFTLNLSTGSSITRSFLLPVDASIG